MQARAYAQSWMQMNVTPSFRSSQKYLVVDDHAGFRQNVKDFLPGERVEVIENDTLPVNSKETKASQKP
jgi:hypothetical protein